MLDELEKLIIEVADDFGVELQDLGELLKLLEQEAGEAGTE